MVELRKLLELQQKLISFNHIHQIMISDLQISPLMILVIFYMFSISDIIKISQLPNRKKIEFKLDGVFPTNINGFALMLTNRLVSVSSDGQRHFDLI